MSSTILAVGDSRTMFQTITLVLEKEGKKIVTARDGIEALDIHHL
jgi:CheY-like chemotaxis protein